MNYIYKYLNILKYSELGLAVPFSLGVIHTTVSSCSDTHISDYIEKKQKLDGKRELKLCDPRNLGNSTPETKSIANHNRGDLATHPEN